MGVLASISRGLKGEGKYCFHDSAALQRDAAQAIEETRSARRRSMNSDTETET